MLVGETTTLPCKAQFDNRVDALIRRPHSNVGRAATGSDCVVALPAGQSRPPVLVSSPNQSIVAIAVAWENAFAATVSLLMPPQ